MSWFTKLWVWGYSLSMGHKPIVCLNAFKCFLPKELASDRTAIVDCIAGSSECVICDVYVRHLLSLRGCHVSFGRSSVVDQF